MARELSIEERVTVRRIVFKRFEPNEVTVLLKEIQAGFGVPNSELDEDTVHQILEKLDQRGRMDAFLEKTLLRDMRQDWKDALQKVLDDSRAEPVTNGHSLNSGDHGIQRIVSPEPNKLNQVILLGEPAAINDETITKSRENLLTLLIETFKDKN